MLDLRLLGPPEVLWDGRPVLIPRRTSRALLFYLAAQGEPAAREQLYLFWGDAPEQIVRTRLRVAVAHVRAALRNAGASAGVITATSEAVGLQPGEWRSDLREFEAGLVAIAGANWPAAAILAGEAALALCRGEFLAGLSLPGAPEFETWLLAERERFARAVLDARTRLTQHHLRSGQPDRARSLALQLVRLDPLDENGQRLLIECLIALGDLDGARRQYDELGRLFARELGVELQPETRALIERLAGSAVVVAASRPPVRAGLPADAPFAGRQAELEELQARWQRVIAGFGQGVLIAGPEGQGKSRLARELTRRIGAHATLLARACHPSDANVPYAALAELLRPGLEPLARGHAPGRAGAGSDAGDQRRAELLRLLPGASTTRRATSDPGGEAELWEALAQHLDALARERPLVLLLDDVQWIDERTRALLAYLTHQLAERAFLWIATLHDGAAEQLAAWLWELAREPNFIRLALPPLAAGDVAQLLGSLVGGVAADVLAPKLMALTEGNPFFLTETLRELQAAGALTGELELATTELALPPSARLAIVRRLVGLSPLAREVAGALAVLGLRGDLDALERVARRRGPALADALDELVRAGIVQDERGEYRFAHGQFREVVLEQMGSGRQRALHDRALDALQRRNRGGQMDADILYHAEQAGKWDAALEAARRAAATAATRYAYADAAALLTRALAALDRLPDDPEMRQELLLAREEALNVLGRREEQHADLAELEKVAEPRIAYRVGRYHHAMGDWAEAEARLRRAVEDADTGTEWSLDARRLLALSIAHAGRADEGGQAALDAVARTGTPAARLVCALALAELAETRERTAEMAAWVAEARSLVGPDTPAGRRLSWLLLASRSAHFDGRHEDALVLAREAQAQAAALGAPDPEARAWLGIANAASRLGHFDEAQGAYDEALKRYRALGQRANLAQAHANLGLLQIRRGALAEASAHCRAAYDAFGALGDALGRCAAGMHLGTSLVRLGQAAEAEPVLRDTAARAAELGLREREVQALQSLGIALLALDRAGEARPALERSIALGDGRPENALSNMWLALVCLALGDLEEADRLSAIAVEDAPRLEPPLIVPQQVPFARALVLRAKGDLAGAQTALADALAARERLLVRLADDNARAAYLSLYRVNDLIDTARRGHWPERPHW